MFELLDDPSGQVAQTMIFVHKPNTTNKDLYPEIHFFEY